MRTLITFVLILLAAAPLMTAESAEKKDEKRSANNEIPALTVPINLQADEMAYSSPTLKVEDLPLVMASADKKTISVVMPPFLYFKTKF